MLLLIDDDPTFLEAAEQLFRGSQPMLLAATAEQAKMLMQSVGPEISAAMVDLDLPDEDGFTLIREIKAEFPLVAIVAISGVFANDVLEAAKLFGAAETLRKPISSEWDPVLIRLAARAAA